MGPLLEAYLDRRFAGWREHTERDDNAGPGGGTPSGLTTEQEAYEVLELKRGGERREQPGDVLIVGHSLTLPVRTCSDLGRFIGELARELGHLFSKIVGVRLVLALDALFGGEGGRQPRLEFSVDRAERS